ncbi:MAG: sulfatase-like hydrolase/transferase, partial [Bacteroidales bacterium]
MNARLKIVTLAVITSGAAQAVENKPNVLIVYTDEHNFRTLESYLPLMGEVQRHPWGANVPLATPNIKFLSDNGVIMNNCYVSTPVSTPSRASLMTGLYPQKTNCTNNDLVLDISLKTLPQLFVENGYVTGYNGKWHLSGDAKPGWNPSPDYGWSTNDFMFNRGHYKYIRDNLSGGDPVIGANTESAATGYEFMTDYLTTKAQNFILREKANPFICMISFPDPHGPNIVSQPYYDMYKGFTYEKPPTSLKNMSQYPGWASGTTKLTQNDYINYWGMVKCIDDNVGRLINTLRDNDLLDNTIIVFTSDHGDMCGEHGRVDKSIPLEASMKVPFIIYAPGILPANKVVQEAVSNIDIYPTLAELCGLNNMPSVDGVSIAPLLRGDEGAVGRNCVFSRSTGASTGWLSVTTSRYKLVHTSVAGDAAWLIDKQIDPDELINFYNNPSYVDIKADLTLRLIDYCEKNNEPKFQDPKIRL